jgi:uncharacterized membrane protein YkoI
MTRTIITASILALPIAALSVGCAKDKPTTQPASAGQIEDYEQTVETKITFFELPDAVEASFNKAYPGAYVEAVEKEVYASGLVHYEIEFKDAAGKEHEVEFDADGEELDEH